VLGWHRVDTVGGNLAVAPQIFARQMEILGEDRQQIPVVHLHEVGTLLASGEPLAHARSRGVVLTFDDAWADNHAHALGPLSRHGLPAMLYAPSRLLGKPGYMTRSQLLEMDAGGVTIGAHSRSHPDLRACTSRQLESEVKGSKEDLEDLLGKPVRSFAYPTGLLDNRVVEAVGAAGFTSAITTCAGWWRPETDPLRVPRSFVQELSEGTFRAAVRGGLNVLGPFDAMKRLGAAASRRGGRGGKS
jgi:peptidoglycan/xylan/chitin deacetylase (PgdA/CDA1 family)